MKQKPHPWTWISLLFIVLSLSMGCGGDSGSSGLDYRGIWHGRTSHGGTVDFNIDSDAVISLQIVDAQANVQLTQPTPLDGDGFSVQNSEGVSSPTSPAVSVQCTFTSETTAVGTYSITRGSSAWTGTFQATRL